MSNQRTKKIIRKKLVKETRKCKGWKRYYPYGKKRKKRIPFLIWIG